MDDKKLTHTEISSLGGKAAHAKGVAYKFNSETARAAALKGVAKRREKAALGMAVKVTGEAVKDLDWTPGGNELQPEGVMAAHEGQAHQPEAEDGA